MKTELNELTEDKSLNELYFELGFQLANGESRGGTICSHIQHQIDVLEKKAKAKPSPNTKPLKLPEPITEANRKVWTRKDEHHPNSPSYQIIENGNKIIAHGVAPELNAILITATPIMYELIRDEFLDMVKTGYTNLSIKEKIRYDRISEALNPTFKEMQKLKPTSLWKLNQNQDGWADLRKNMV